MNNLHANLAFDSGINRKNVRKLIQLIFGSPSLDVMYFHFRLDPFSHVTLEVPHSGCRSSTQLLYKAGYQNKMQHLFWRDQVKCCKHATQLPIMTILTNVHVYFIEFPINIRLSLYNAFHKQRNLQEISYGRVIKWDQ